MKTLLIILTVLFLQGCQTTAGYKQKVETYHGQPVSIVLQNWGAPDKAIEHKGLMYLSYHRSKQIIIGSNSQIGGVTRICLTTFVISNGIVISHKFEGELCRA